MPYNPKLPNPKNAIKIIVIDEPEFDEPNEGLYDLRIGSDSKNPIHLNIHTLKIRLKELLPFSMHDRIEHILSTLQNFKKCYINTQTTEITI